MSYFNYIASDIQLPEIDLMEIVETTVKGLKELRPQPQTTIPLDILDDNKVLVLRYDEYQTLVPLGPDDILDGLSVTIYNNPFDDINNYIKRKYIYELNYDFTEKSATQLLEYLQENMMESQTVEIWRIWCGHNIKPEVVYKGRVALSDITNTDLADMMKKEICICIER